MSKEEVLLAISDKIAEIELMQPWALGIEIDFTPIEEIQDAINRELNPDLFDFDEDD